MFRSRALTPSSFARKYPRPHLLIGSFDPGHSIGAVEPSRLDVLRAVIGGLGVVGEHTAIEDARTATLRLAFALGEDAARLCAFVRAIPKPSLGDSATTAVFSYDRHFHEQFSPAVAVDSLEAVKAFLMRRDLVPLPVATAQPVLG